jgi:4-alpha-glucanotransferase
LRYGGKQLKTVRETFMHTQKTAVSSMTGLLVLESRRVRKQRASGILLHPTSLPGKFGIGDLGRDAYAFVDFLEETGQSFWQMLPLGPTGFGDSPYQCFSAFAGNPILISLEQLAAQGLLDVKELESAQGFSDNHVDYGRVIEFKNAQLWKAFETFEAHATKSQRAEFKTFSAGASSWLDDYAVYRSIKDGHEGKEWTKWEKHLRAREEKALYFWRENHAKEIRAHKFFQWFFFRQWLQLAHYANAKGIRIIGDIPIFVAHDSADVWAHPGLFHLDAKGKAKKVAGVPPDYFSETGQLWGNPLYRWDVMARSGYSWWIDRLKSTLQLFDVIRLDHFRGFEKYWAVPGHEETAVSGKWESGPGPEFFHSVKAALGEIPIIAEDLGFITKEVEALRDQFGFHGMRILQFAFGNDDSSDNFKPYNFPPNCVVYTGTHDNDTTVGWFRSAGAGDSTRSDDDVKKEREFVLRYLGTDGREIHWDMIRLAMSSVAMVAIVPLQDVLGLGSEARMNIPARESGNWSWRYRREQLDSRVRSRLKEMTETYGRNPRVSSKVKATEEGEISGQ